jgi:signal peptidase I
LGLVGLTILWIQPGHAPLGATITVALIAGSAPNVIDALARARAPGPVAVVRSGTVTTAVRLGAEPPEIARTSIILAARAGPTVVIATRHCALLDTLGPIDVPVFIASSYEEALRDAARAIPTTAIAVVSASAFPVAEACVAAAGQLRDGVGWATGRSESPNRDRYAPREREMLAESVRTDARLAGATLWEPDATLVRTDLVVAYPIAPGRPWGSWLRALEARGYRGIELAVPIALRAAPADAPQFWPSQMMRTRATAADLSGAIGAGPGRARVLAGAALMRELYGWPLALWAFIPLLIGWSGSFPLSCAPLTFVGALGITAIARWSANRLAHHVGLHPIHEARAAAYDTPGSLLALPSAITRTIRRRRIRIPEQPLLWFALAFTLTTTVLLLNRATTSDTGANIAAGAAVLNLVLLWTVAIRAIGKRGWDRSVYRLPVDLIVVVNGTAARMIEASSAGCAVAGRFPDTPVGSIVTMIVVCADRSELALEAMVANRRATTSGDEVLGFALQLGPEVRIAWVGALFDAAGRMPAGRSPRGLGRRPTERRERTARVRTFAFRLQIVLVGLVSIVAASILVLVLLGLRPLVISSGSMRPTLEVGDVVVTSWVPADHIRAGNIVSFGDPDQNGLFLTHRVRSIVDDGSTLRFETRGDANTTSEIWAVPRRTLLKRTAWKVPIVGGVASRFGSTPVRAGLLGACTALAAALVIGAARRARRARVQRASMKSMEPFGDADPKNRAVPNEEIEPSSPSR